MFLEAMTSPPATAPRPTMSDASFAEFIARAAKRLAIESAEYEQREYETGLRDLLRPVLEQRLVDDLEKIKKPSTRRLYIADCKKFKEYCEAIDMPFRPAAPEIVSFFLLDQADGGASAHTVNRMVAAISHAHRLGETFDPTEDVLVRATVRNIVKRPHKPQTQTKDS